MSMNLSDALNALAKGNLFPCISRIRTIGSEQIVWKCKISYGSNLEAIANADDPDTALIGAMFELPMEELMELLGNLDINLSELIREEEVKKRNGVIV